MSLVRNMLKVFVYGTLKNGEPNHSWLTKLENGTAKFLEIGSTVTEYPLVVATRYNIPFLLDKPNVGHRINGEIYSIDEQMLKNLDILEDYPKLYDRKLIDISDKNGQLHSCLIYFLKQYPANFLDNRKLLSEYKNRSDQQYIERSQRIANIRAIDDLDYRVEQINALA